MATLYIAEYASISIGQAGRLHQHPDEPPLNEQTLSIGVGSNASAAFQPQTRMVRLHTDAICSVAFGTNPTATTNNQRLAANQTEYKGVPLGQGFKVAVIQNS